MRHDPPGQRRRGSERAIRRSRTWFRAFEAIAIGGDHTIPLPILRALATDRPVGALHFDTGSTCTASGSTPR